MMLKSERELMQEEKRKTFKWIHRKWWGEKKENSHMNLKSQVKFAYFISSFGICGLDLH